MSGTILKCYTYSVSSEILIVQHAITPFAMQQYG